MKFKTLFIIIGVCVVILILVGIGNNNSQQSQNTDTTLSQTDQASAVTPSPAPVVTPKPAPKPKVVTPAPVQQTKAGCGFKAEFDADKAWMHACALQNLVTPACQQLYNIQGDYIQALNPDFFGGTPQHFGDSMVQYVNDKSLCFCKLPTNLAKQLNDAATSAENFCNIYPN